MQSAQPAVASVKDYCSQTVQIMLTVVEFTSGKAHA